MQKAEIDIYSKVNEVFAKTVVTHKILNNSNKPIELEVFIDKYLDNNMFSSFEAQIGKSTKAKSKVIKAEKAEDKNQKYVFLNDDLQSYITTINKNFDFKTFNNKTLKDVEIVSK